MNENKIGAGEPLGEDAYMESYDKLTGASDTPESSTEQAADNSAETLNTAGAEQQETAAEGGVETEDRLAPGRARLEAVMASGSSLKAKASGFMGKARAGISSFFGKAKDMGVKTAEVVLSTPELAQEAKEKGVEKFNETGEKLSAWSDRMDDKLQGAVAEAVTVVEEHLRSAGKTVIETKEDAVKAVNEVMEASGNAVLATFDGIYNTGEAIGGKIDSLVESGKEKVEQARQTVSNMATVSKIIGAMAVEGTQETVMVASQAIQKKYEEVSNFAGASAERFASNIRSVRSSWLNKINTFRMNKYQEKAEKNQEKANAMAAKIEALGMLQNVTPEAVEQNTGPLAAAA